MPDRRCCCLVSGDCDILTDTFIRDNSTDLGDDWYEALGDWAISSNALVLSSLDGDATGRVMTTAKNTWSRRGWVQVEFTVTGTGPWEFSILVDSDREGTEYQDVTVTLSTTECTVAAGGQSRTFNTGTDSGTKPAAWIYPGSPTSQTWLATCCLTNNMLYVSLTADGEDFAGCVWEINGIELSGKNAYAGLLTTNTDIQFTNFVYTAHDHDYADFAELGQEDDDCNECNCTCGTYGDADFSYPPWRIRIDVSGGDFYDGGYMIMDAAVCGPEQSGHLAYICTEGTVGTIDQDYESTYPAQTSLSCWEDAVDEGVWVLYWLALCVTHHWITDPETYTCNPLYVEWKQYQPYNSACELDPDCEIDPDDPDPGPLPAKCYATLIGTDGTD